MSEYIVIDTSLEQDLSRFSQYLWEQKVSHRIIENDGRQLLLVGSEADAIQVSVAYQAFLDGTAALPTIKHETVPTEDGVVQRLFSTPVTLIFMLLSIAGYFIVALDADYSIVSQLTFFEFQRVGPRILFSFPETEYWRMFTPIFLHFGVLHIVFNTLWLWDLGRRVELLQGTYSTVGLLLLMGMGSNLIQVIYSPVGVFGGMSGVIYGLLGYGWMWSWICPERSLQIPKPVIIFMLVWLVLCMFGFAKLLGAGEVANAAHAGGLIMGVILGIGAGVIARVGNKQV